MKYSPHGLRLSLGAMESELGILQRELRGIQADILAGRPEVITKHNLQNAKIHADRISALCGAEIGRLIERLNRRPELQAAE